MGQRRVPHGFPRPNSSLRSGRRSAPGPGPSRTFAGSSPSTTPSATSAWPAERVALGNRVGPAARPVAARGPVREHPDTSLGSSGGSGARTTPTGCAAPSRSSATMWPTRPTYSNAHGIGLPLRRGRVSIWRHNPGPESPRREVTTSERVRRDGLHSSVGPQSH